MIFNPANVLTLLRLFLAPVFIYLFWVGNYSIALFVFITASITDLIDGTVARCFGGESLFGARLDPIADKLLMQGAFISLLITNVIPLWLFLIILFRDIFVIFGIFYFEWRQVKFEYKPSIISKLTTLFQAALAGLGIVYYGNLGPSWPWAWIWPVSVYVTVVFTAMSVLIYLSRGLKILSHHEV